MNHFSSNFQLPSSLLRVIFFCISFASYAISFGHSLVLFSMNLISALKVCRAYCEKINRSIQFNSVQFSSIQWFLILSKITQMLIRRSANCIQTNNGTTSTTHQQARKNSQKNATTKDVSVKMSISNIFLFLIDIIWLTISIGAIFIQPAASPFLTLFLQLPRTRNL